MKLKMTKIKLPPFISKLLINKYVLYIVAFLALINVLGYLMAGNVNIAILFVLIGYIMTFFSKNMVVVLLVPLILVSLFISGKIIKEGFSAAADLAKDAGNPKKKNDDLVSEDDVDAQGKMEIPTPPIMPGAEGSPNEDTFEVGRKKGGQSRIDYGSTIEKAYDDLNDVLGGDGIKQLTQDTQKLMKQQLQLAEAMQGMGPMLSQAQDMMKTLNLQDVDLGSMMKQLNGNKGSAVSNSLIQKE